MAQYFIEKRRRGIVGWFFLLLFLGWNALMIFWLVWSMSIIAAPDLKDAGAGGTLAQGIAGGIVLFTVLPVWALGSIITGLLAMLTRGSTKVISERGRREPPRINMR